MPGDTGSRLPLYWGASQPDRFGSFQIAQTATRGSGPLSAARATGEVQDEDADAAEGGIGLGQASPGGTGIEHGGGEGGPPPRPPPTRWAEGPGKGGGNRLPKRAE